MKKRISILFILLCLFACIFSVNPIIAEEGEETETTAEVLELEETDPEEEVEAPLQEKDPEEEGQGEVLPPEEEGTEETDEETKFVVPENFVLRKGDALAREAIKREGVPERLPDLVEGEDCRERELVFLADDQEYAEAVAEIYHAELTKFDNGIAVITLVDDSLTVAEVVEAATNEEGLPLVEPNYIIRLNPPVDHSELFTDHFKSGEVLDNSWGWNEWVNDVLGDEADPFLRYPGTEYWEWYSYGDAFQWQHDAINTYAAWNTTMGENVKVAVIDEGVNPDHEEFYQKTYGSTYILDLANYDDPSDPNPYGTGHGNHVAGIIGAAVGNTAGGAGVAPEATILSINVFNEYGATDSNTISNAIYDAVESGANIINMSLGGYWYSFVEDEAIQAAYEAGVVVVAAAGNDGTDIKNFPAAYDHVIAVAATTKNGTKASYSNFGSWVTIAAPGSDIVSSISMADDETDYYDIESGTSMAAPVVSGALALYMSKVGPIDYDETVKVLKKSVTKSSSKQIGYGIINLELMFKKIDTEPVFNVVGPDNKTITDLSKPVPEGSVVVITKPTNYVYDPDSEQGYMPNNEYLLYTTNGKNPSIKDNEVVNGEVVYGSGYGVIYLDTFEKGKTITISAGVVNGLGVLGKVKKIKIKTPLIDSSVQPFKTKELALDTTTLSLQKYFSWDDGSHDWEGHNNAYVHVSKLVDTNGVSHSPSDLSGTDHIWVSSNENVCKVIDVGGGSAIIYTTGAGSAKVTLKMQDGSGKSATVKVTSTQIAEEIVITGQESIAKGGSATYKATLLPSNTKNKKVKWEIYHTSIEGVTLSSSGKLTIPANATTSDYIIMSVTPLDDSSLQGLKAYYIVRVCEKATSIDLSVNSEWEYYTDRVTYSKKGALTGVTLFTVDMNDQYNTGVDNQIKLDANIVGNSMIPTWTSSNTKVATVDETGLITARSAGTAKITCATVDGSNKKQTITVTVKVPVSSLSIDIGDYFVLGAGKSIDLSKYVAYGSQYGKPTTAKANWYIYEVGYHNYQTNSSYSLYDELTQGKTKYITVSSSGKLSASSKLKKYLATLGYDLDYGYVFVYLTAAAADGSYHSDYTEIYVQNPITKVKFYDYFETKYQMSKTDDYIQFFLLSNEFTYFELKSSNPSVGSVVIDYENAGWDSGLQMYYYPVYFINNSGKKGAATITAKALDGSNKSAKTKVTVK